MHVLALWELCRRQKTLTLLIPRYAIDAEISLFVSGDSNYFQKVYISHQIDCFLDVITKINIC